MNGRVICKRDTFEHKIGSITLPQGTHRSKEGSRLGTVLAVNDKSPVKIGDRIIFTKFAGNTVEIDGEEVYIVDERLILGTVED